MEVFTEQLHVLFFFQKEILAFICGFPNIINNKVICQSNFDLIAIRLASLPHLRFMRSSRLDSEMFLFLAVLSFLSTGSFLPPLVHNMWPIVLNVDRKEYTCISFDLKGG
jgi:hypothetical protein